MSNRLDRTLNGNGLVVLNDIINDKIHQAVSTAGGFPAGGIIIWSGAATNIPSGWALCDGTNGTPDLRSRFVLGAGSSYSVGATGGEETHKLTINEMPKHNHAVNDLTKLSNAHSVQSIAPYTMAESWTNNTTLIKYAGGDAAHNNMPPYYALCYIMKL